MKNSKQNVCSVCERNSGFMLPERFFTAANLCRRFVLITLNIHKYTSNNL